MTFSLAKPLMIYLPFSSSGSKRRKTTADFISRTALAAVVIPRTGANAHRLMLRPHSALNSLENQNRIHGFAVEFLR